MKVTVADLIRREIQLIFHHHDMMISFHDITKTLDIEETLGFVVVVLMLCSFSSWLPGTSSSY